MKAYTDLEQSKKLAEILPLESADMYYAGHQSIINPKEWEYEDTPKISGKYISFDDKRIFYPCWSLAALFNVIPKDESIDCSLSFGYYDGKGEYIEKWLCAFEKEGETTDNFIIETIDGDNPVDACVKMIIYLHEQKLL